MSPNIVVGGDDPKLIPPHIYQLLNNHPYTLTYRQGSGNYDYLAEHIGSIARMRSYTDLLEKLNGLMRRHVARVNAATSPQYENVLEASTAASSVCTTNCLGLPKGTKLFEIDFPPFRLQAAELKGQFKIISARALSQ